MKTFSDDVQFEAMVLPGESLDAYIDRLRDLSRDADARFERASREQQKALAAVKALRAAGATLTAVTEAMDVVSAAARTVGSARYRKQSCEFFLQDAIFRITAG
jgi:DNA topoisomerase IB